MKVLVSHLRLEARGRPREGGHRDTRANHRCGEGKHAQGGRLMKGREILFMVYTHYKVSEAEGHILDFQDLLTVKSAWR